MIRFDAGEVGCKRDGDEDQKNFGCGVLNANLLDAFTARRIPGVNGRRQADMDFAKPLSARTAR